MSKQTDEGSVTPAYGSLKTVESFSDATREKGHIPMRIDRSEMQGLSGSAAKETISTLRFFGLIDDKAEPTPLFSEFVMEADEKRRIAVLVKMVRKSYAFLFEAENFDIERATSSQVHELFRARGVNGSTLTRAVSLFLAATKRAGIKISPSIKPPKNISTGTRPKKDKKGEGQEEVEDGDEAPAGKHRFELPIPGKPSVLVLVPESMDAEDWDMLSQMFSIYVNRWKSFKPPAKAAKKELEA